MENPENQIPFNNLEPLHESGAFFQLNELRNNPNFYVKELRNYSELFYYTDVKTIASTIQKYNEYIKASDLKYYVPATQAVIAKNSSGEETVFVISDKIIGKEITKDGLSEESKNQLVNIVSNFIDIYIQTYDVERGRGKMAECWKLRNYIFGHKTTNDQDQVFFVDLYPVMLVWPDEVVDDIRLFASEAGIPNKRFDDQVAKLRKLSALK